MCQPGLGSNPISATHQLPSALPLGSRESHLPGPWGTESVDELPGIWRAAQRCHRTKGTRGSRLPGGGRTGWGDPRSHLPAPTAVQPGDSAVHPPCPVRGLCLWLNRASRGPSVPVPAPGAVPVSPGVAQVTVEACQQSSGHFCPKTLGQAPYPFQAGVPLWRPAACASLSVGFSHP